MDGPPAATEVRVAGTLMMVRDSARGLEVYMTRRDARSRFVPDAFVFPGGAVDAGDRDQRLHQRLYGDVHPDRAITVATLREAFEEAGVFFGTVDGGSAASDVTRAAARSAVLEGRAFIDVLTEYGLQLDASGVLPYSQWITPASEPIRFDTHFFVARVPPGQMPEADSREVYDGRWLTPASALQDAADGRVRIVYPTQMHLARLGEFTDVEALLADARSRKVTAVQPVSLDDGTFALPAKTGRW